MRCVMLKDVDKATNFLNHRLLTKMEVAEEIIVARNGKEALDYLHKAHKNPQECCFPELIFLDINMPLINGWEFLEEYESLAEDFDDRAVIIMLTTSLRTSDEQLFKESKKVKDYLYKPLTADKVQKIFSAYFPQFEEA